MAGPDPCLSRRPAPKLRANRSVPLPLTTEASGLSDVGKKRQHNEDAMLIEPALGLYIVADGMGGHAAGEVASAWAIRIAKEHISAHHKVLADLADNPSPARRAAASALVEAAIQ